jgi:hypothetical protein
MDENDNNGSIVTFHIKPNSIEESSGNKESEEDEIPFFLSAMSCAKAEIWADILLEKTKEMYPNLVVTKELRQEFIRISLEKDA